MGAPCASAGDWEDRIGAEGLAGLHRSEGRSARSEFGPRVEREGRASVGELHAGEGTACASTTSSTLLYTLLILGRNRPQGTPC